MHARTRTPRAIQHAAKVCACILFGLGLTFALCWSAAAIFPPSNVLLVSEAERTVTINSVTFRQRAFRCRMTGSPLAWAASYCTSHCDRLDPSGPEQVHSSAASASSSASFASIASAATPGPPPSSSVATRAPSLASAAPLGTARVLMPWLEPGSPNPDLLSVERHLFAYGWPFPALAQIRQFSQPSPNSFSVSQEGSVAIPAFISRGRNPPAFWSAWTFPCLPLWPGLLLNTLSFAAGAWLSLAAAHAARRSLRRRRGLCPACAYDLRATPAGNPCPECGSAASLHDAAS